MKLDFTGRNVVVLRGTTGVGLEVALAFARHGARVFLLGSPAGTGDLGLQTRFAVEGAGQPVLLGDGAAAVQALDRQLAAPGMRVHALVGRVAATPQDGALDLEGSDLLSERVQADAWQLIDLIYATRRHSGHLPRYVVALGSDAGQCAYPGYGTAAASQAVLETLCRYVTTHLLEEEFTFNVVRSPLLLQEAGVAPSPVTAAQVAGAALALCSGHLDALSGQIVDVDAGLRVGAAAPAPPSGPPRLNDLADKAVLVTGGTRGIGLETGLAFGRLGARVWLTYRWGGHDEDEIRSRFAAAGAAEPHLVEADASNPDDTRTLFEQIARQDRPLRVFVNNVTFAYTGKVGPELPYREVARSLRYSAWPLVDYLQRSQARLGYAPPYVVAISSPGSRHFYPGYDVVAAVKAAMEALCRHLCATLGPQGARLNILRSAPVHTESLQATFGPDLIPFCHRYDHRFRTVARQDVASACLALCSGLLDGLQGATLFLDHGIGFSDNIPRLFDDRRRYGL